MEVECAVNVDKVEKTSAGYKKRGNRCEGTFRKNVNYATNLRVIGYHFSHPQFDFLRDHEVKLHLVGYSGEGPASIKLTSVRASDYYQMDTTWLDSQDPFTWPLDVVKSLEDPFGPQHVAAIGCSKTCTTKIGEIPLLFPVRFSAESVDKPFVRPTILIVAEAEIKLLTATLYVDGELIYENKTVADRFVPPRRTLKLALGQVEGETGTLILRGRNRLDDKLYYEVNLVLAQEND